MASKKESLKPLILEKLKSSGIPESKYSVMKLSEVSMAELRRKNLPEFKAVKIPYFNLDGKITNFYRYRYFEDTRSEWEKLTNKKPLRYIQESKTLNKAYLPPLDNWRKIADTPEIPIVITEGEFKSFSVMHNTKIPTIGLGGVWSFKSKSRNIDFLPDLEEFKWADRSVVICFDNDVIYNTDVLIAESYLARLLTDFGAFVSIARIPYDGSKKLGADDYINENGADRFKEILNEAEAYTEVEELTKLNTEVAILNKTLSILRLSDGVNMTRSTFVDIAYADRSYTTTVNGDEKCVSAPAAWLRWPGRRVLQDIDYIPGNYDSVVNGVYNTWKGWKVQPVKGNISPWNILMEYVFANQPEERKWFESWLAYPLQNPGVKLFTACLIWSRYHGTGKSLIGHTMFRLYGNDNCAEIGESNLHGDFNDWAVNKQFIMGEEITGGDKRHQSDRMKSFITQKRLYVNRKYEKPYWLTDCINYYFTSNHPDSFFLEDKDRRYFIHEIKGPPMNFDFYEKFDTWYKSDEGASALFHYFLELNTSEFKPHAPAPLTSSKRDMIDIGKSDLAMWVDTLQKNPSDVLRIGNEILPYDLISAEELLMLYDPNGKRVTANGMARELRRNGFEKVYRGMPLQINEEIGSLRLWAVRRPEKWLLADGTALRAQYLKERGVNTPTKPKGIKIK